MVDFKSQYIEGETIKVSLCIQARDEGCFVVLICDGERRTFDCDKDGSRWVALIDSSELGVNRWSFSVWRKFNHGREVVARGSFEVCQIDAEYASPLEEARKNVEILKQARTGIFKSGVKRNKVRDREVERFTPQELLEELRYWEQEVYRLELKAGVRNRKNMRFFC